MPKIEDVIVEWKTDSAIDQTNLLGEIIKTPSIHAKYVEYFLFFKNKLACAEMKYGKMAYLKRKYYRGEMTKSELDELGWPQYQGLKANSSELNQLLTMDPDMVDLASIVQSYKSSVSVVEYIMKQITYRDSSLKTAVDIQKFLSGN